MQNKKLAVFGVLVIAAMLCGAFLSVYATDFNDVQEQAWYADAVAYVQEQGLMNGNTPTEFAPEDNLTRAMLVTVLYRAAGEPAVSGDDGFSDTASGQWYGNAVLWATQQGVINGYGNGLFGPDDAITQQQLSLVMSRYAGQSVTADIPGFAGGTEPASRAQVAAALLNLSRLPETAAETEQQEEETMKMNIQIGDNLLTATLVDNSSTRALLELLADGPITIAMNDYASMEKVGPFPQSLPTNDEPINTDAGDLILYQGRSFVIYYGTNSWNFTRLGKIDNVTQHDLMQILGRGGVTAVLSLPE